MLPEVNEYNTSLEALNIESYPKEVQEAFWDFFYNVPYIQSLTSPKRLRAKDLPRDNEGKIIIDITKPHILENMDYFRPTALHYIKTGKFTDLRPNPNPNSEFGKWFLEEVRRCREGYVRPSDGEWVTGDLYFYLNYNLISLTEQKDKKSKKALRIVAPPHVWDGHYYKFHYLNQARENGKHCLELASRQKGKTICAASLLARRFYLGESAEVNKRVNCYVTAQDTKFIKNNADQTLDKFQFIIDFLADNTEFPKRRLVSSLQQMQWTSGFIDLDTNTRKGTLNSVTGISAKDDESKLRGTRGVLYILEEAGTFPRLIKLWNNMLPSVQDGDMVYGTLFGYGCCCAGTKVWTSDGVEKNIEDLQLSDGILAWNGSTTEVDKIKQQINLGKKPCVRLVTTAGRFLDCSIDHPIYKATIHNFRNKSNSNKRDRIYEWDFVPAENLKVGDKIGVARHIESWGNETLFDAYLVGVLIGDGSYGIDNTPKLSNEDVEILDYVKSKYDWSLDKTHITKKERVYEEIRIKNICKYLREIGIYGQTKTRKRLPVNYKNLTKEDTLKLIAGLIDTDGYVFYSDKREYCYINIVQSSKELLEQVKFLIRKLGATSNIIKVNPTIKEGRKDKNAWYALSIDGLLNIKALKDLPLKVSRKKDALQRICNFKNIRVSHYDSDNIILDTIAEIKDIGEQYIYNMEVTKNHTYLANNFITHNTAGDNQSDFYAMAEMMYHPDGYDIYGVENVYDLEGKGGKKFSYFFPGYMNYSGMYDKNGNSDVTKALITILQKRYEKKKSTSDFTAVTKLTAEIPIVPQEAIIRTRGNFFPVALINERIAQLELNPNETDDTLVGTLVQNPDGTVKFKPTDDEVIVNFPLKDNNARGALQIFKLPEEVNGRVSSDRYVIGHDPVNQDAADSLSLSSTFVIDLYTESIAAEYTGRKDFQDESFELLRLLGIFYNARILYESNNKMCYAYFSKMNCTYMLADTPEYLREKDIVKSTGIGNSSKGVPATAMLNKHEDELLRDWLLMPKTKVETNSDGDEVETSIPNVMTIKNIALLRELSRYAPEVNTDRVRAIGIAMIMRNQLIVTYGGDLNQQEDEYEASQDDFFKRNGFI